MNLSPQKLPQVSSEARQGSTRFDFSELETTKRRLEVPMGIRWDPMGSDGGMAWTDGLGKDVIYIYGSMICNCYIYMIYDICIYDTHIYIYIDITCTDNYAYMYIQYCMHKFGFDWMLQCFGN